MLAMSACDSRKKAHEIGEININPHYIGHHIIDLPEEFSLVSVMGSFVPIDDNPLETKMEVELVGTDMTRQQFLKALEIRRSELEAKGSAAEDLLKAVIKQSDESTLFRILEVKDAYEGELNIFLDGVYLRIAGHSYHAAYEEAERAILQFGGKVFPKTAFAFGTEHKSQIPGAFSIGPVFISGANAREAATYTFRSSKRPDLVVEVTVDSFRPDERESLLKRTSGEDSLLNKFDVRHRVLRKGEVNVTGMRAQEWLGVAHLSENKGESEYGFALETMRADPGVLKPFIHVELNSGQYDEDGSMRTV